MRNKIVKLKLKGYDVTLLDQTAKNIVNTCIKDSVKVTGPIPLPTEKSIYTILRATHKYGYTQEQFEKRVHKRLIQLINPTDKIIDSLQRLEMSAGIEIQIKL